MSKPKNSDKKRHSFKPIVGFIVSGLLVAVSVFLLTHRQYVVDAVAVMTYSPSSKITTITDDVKFTTKGKFIFYASRPVVESQDDFNGSCPRQESSSPILGCYTTEGRIYVYDVTNEKLDGIQQVTAAHEMLHAAWARTSSSDKAKLETELKAAYSKVSDASLKERMDYYQRTEPGEFANELHSILGTEVANLGSSLEAYYDQYFDRSAVLAQHDKYSSAYTELYAQATELSQKMTELASSIQTRQAAYEEKLQTYSADVSSFNTRARSGQFTSESQFYAERSALTARLNALDAEREAINSNIETYNSYSTEYESIANQIEGLNESIDSFNQLDAPSSV